MWNIFKSINEIKSKAIDYTNKNKTYYFFSFWPQKATYWFHLFNKLEITKVSKISSRLVTPREWILQEGSGYRESGSNCGYYNAILAIPVANEMLC